VSDSSDREANVPLLAHDGLVWRRLARLGAAHGPGWFVEYSPPLIGLCAALLLPSMRRTVRDNLRRVRGAVGRAREVRDVAETFTSYAGCLAEGLTSGSKNERPPEVSVSGAEHAARAVAGARGVILVTAHTAGWELAGPVFRERTGVDLVMVMEAERDRAARELQDRARRARGLGVVHVGKDPLASLTLVRQLRAGAALGLQLDRVPRGMRGVAVRLFGQPGQIPEGPIRLSQVSGAPILPVFCARLGHRRYLVELFEGTVVPRRPAPAEVKATAQRLADAMTDFVRRHPTQWFAFGHGRVGAPAG
jgi:KDO2-lipid IV(A) lauroyltransferase